MRGNRNLGEVVALRRGTTYQGALVGHPGPALLGLGSIVPGGGFRSDYKTYGGECPPELMLSPGDLYVSLKGATKDGEMIGSVARVPDSISTGRLTQDTVRLVFKEQDAALERYVYWLLRTPEYRRYCAARATGSAVVALSRDDFLSYPVPPLNRDRGLLVDALENIESLIERNSHVSEIAADLCDGLAAQMCDQNPTAAARLTDVVAFNRASVKPGAPEDPLLYVDIASVSAGRIDEVKCTTWSDAPSRARRAVADGDVIFSTVRPGRRSFSLILEPDPRTVVSTGFAVMSPSDAIGSSLLTSVARSSTFATYLESVAHGSAYPAVSTAAMGRFEVQIPTPAVVHEHERQTMPLRRLSHRALRGSETLRSLRDELLGLLNEGRVAARRNVLEPAA